MPSTRTGKSSGTVPSTSSRGKVSQEEAVKTRSKEKVSTKSKVAAVVTPPSTRSRTQSPIIRSARQAARRERLSQQEEASSRSKSKETASKSGRGKPNNVISSQSRSRSVSPNKSTRSHSSREKINSQETVRSSRSKDKLSKPVAAKGNPKKGTSQRFESANKKARLSSSAEEVNRQETVKTRSKDEISSKPKRGRPPTKASQPQASNESKASASRSSTRVATKTSSNNNNRVSPSSQPTPQVTRSFTPLRARRTASKPEIPSLPNDNGSQKGQRAPATETAPRRGKNKEKRSSAELLPPPTSTIVPRQARNKDKLLSVELTRVAVPREGGQKRKIVNSSSSSESESNSQESESESSDNHPESQPQLSSSRQCSPPEIPSWRSLEAVEEVAVAEETRDEVAQPQRRHVGNPNLPDVSLLPLPSDVHCSFSTKLQILRGKIREILSVILNRIQDNELNVDDAYKVTEKIYEYYSTVYGKNGNYQEGDVTLGARKYRNMVVYVIWSFGAVVWKVVKNPGIQKIKDFISTCMERLGWVAPTRKNNVKPFKEFKDSKFFPAAYYAVNMLVKYISDPHTFIRQSQLQIVQRLVELANYSNNLDFLDHVFQKGFKTLLIRLKDKHTGCRIAAMSILCRLVKVSGGQEALAKELKYYTRYDPSVEVRRIGTMALSEVARMRLRFFFDQAFDRNSSVRLEAFKAMAIEIQEEVEIEVEGSQPDGENNDTDNGQVQTRMERRVRLLRDMNQITSERLCNIVLWGTVYADSVKCANYVQSELLSKWLKLSCGNDLIKFLTYFDAFANMKSAIKILDMTISSSKNFAEDLNLKFITELKGHIKFKRYKSLNVEELIAWLSVCKASQKYESLRKVVPDSVEMLELLEDMHHCCHLENEQAEREGKTEEAAPILAVVAGLGICRYVTWEEAGRNHLKVIVKKLLQDQLLDEKMLVVEALTLLKKLCDPNVDEFDDLMLEIFQDVFDADNDYNRGKKQRNEFVENRNVALSVNDASESSRRSSITSIVNIAQQSSGTTIPTQPAKPLPSIHVLTKMKDKICELAIQRHTLMHKRDEFIKNKEFLKAIPLEEEITRLQNEEQDAKKELQLVEDRNTTTTGLSGANITSPPGPSASVPTEDKKSSNSIVCSNDGEIMDYLMDVDQEEEGENELQQSRVITSIEEGLLKGLLMINGYMELRPKMNSFLRNLYQNHISVFMADADCNIRAAVLQFLTRIGILEKRELRKVTNILVTVLMSDKLSIVELTMAFKCLIDLLMVYDWKEFMLNETEKDESDEFHPYKKNFTLSLQKILQTQEVSYETVNVIQMRKFFIELLMSRYVPQNRAGLDDQQKSCIKTVRNQGILKLIARGRLHDPVIMSNILILWANVDYSGTPLLRDIESVLKCYGAFSCWETSEIDSEEYVTFMEGEEDDMLPLVQDGEQRDLRNEVEEKNHKDANRVLGIGFALAVVKLSEEARNESILLKFVSYMIDFIDQKDQPLMRSIITKILSTVKERSSSSYNTMLIRSASKIRITNFNSAKIIVKQIHNLLEVVINQPATNSVTSTKKELKDMIKKYIRVFGEEVAFIDDPTPGNRSRIAGDDIEFFDDEEDDDQRSEDERNNINNNNNAVLDMNRIMEEQNRSGRFSDGLVD